MIFKPLFPEVLPLADQNVHDFLFNKPARTPDVDYPIHIDALTGVRRTRSEFIDRVRDGATALVAPLSSGGFEIGPNEHVGILSYNCLDYLALMHSLLVVTIPFALLSAYSTTPYEIAHAAKSAKVTRIFVEPSLLQVALQAAQEAGIPEERIHILNGIVKGRKSYAEAIDEVERCGVPRTPVKPADRNTFAYAVFSSGTTGAPKVVMLTHGNVCFSLVQGEMIAKEEPPLPKAMVILAPLPMSHTYGLGLIAFRGFRSPTSLIIFPKWDLELVLEVVPKFRVNGLYLRPSQLHELVHCKNLKKEHFVSVMVIGCGSAYLPPKLALTVQQAIRPGLPVVQGFGMSEIASIALRMLPPSAFGGRVPPDFNAVGLLVAGLEARIILADGSEGGVNEPGELWLRGANISPGYFGDEAATREAFAEGGWFKTGDHFRIDQHGRFYFVDRAKEIFKVADFQVSPTELEDVLRAQPDGLITDVAVAGVPVCSNGVDANEHIPRAWIVLSEKGKQRGGDAVMKLLDEWVRQKLTQYKWVTGGYEVVAQACVAGTLIQFTLGITDLVPGHIDSHVGRWEDVSQGPVGAICGAAGEGYINLRLRRDVVEGSSYLLCVRHARGNVLPMSGFGSKARHRHLWFI
ncbi:uncharacterized protein FIBRA_00273 [Fibroporia radiculosa]|uniref:AMP-dependent synthetase/ligase domain-containing protein n=1 Tax=Fibroporia radiculosa TaxID=599839 RepID=J7S5X1_9APHY|nr:uncharacterized protein FIBRA_00273 [Fibroporia radiculosa]CCL98279.1 predicted protein [Fibroporia radiculosa]